MTGRRRERRLRSIAAGCCAVLAAAGCGVGSPAAAHSTEPAGYSTAPPCQTSHIAVSAASSGTLDGRWYALISYQNTGSASCAAGFLGAVYATTALGDQYAGAQAYGPMLQVPQAVLGEYSAASSLDFTLAPGQAAGQALQGPETMPDDDPCPGFASLQVYLGDDADPDATLSADLPGLHGAVPDCGYFDESAVYRLADFTAATTSGTVSPSPSAPALPAPACAADQLSVAAVDGASVMGRLGVVVEFTNHGTASCALSGYPTVEAYTLSGGEYLGTQDPQSGSQGTPFLAGTAAGTPAVVLAPGGSAAADLSGASYLVRRDRPCPAFQRLWIAAPGTGLSGQTVSARVPGYAADFPDCGAFAVSPVYPMSDFLGLGSPAAR